MSLFAIGDLHLHFQSELKAPGQLHGAVWQNHEAVFRRNCEKLIRPEDTLVLVGDHSWGRNLAEAEKDLEYICDLPGRKARSRYYRIGNRKWGQAKAYTLTVDASSTEPEVLAEGIAQWLTGREAEKNRRAG